MFESSDPGDNPCSMNLDQNIAALLSYALGAVGGFVFYFFEKDNVYVRFCAMQSLLICAFWIASGVVLTIGSRLPGLGIILWILNILISVAIVGLLAFLAFQAFKNVKVSLPIIGNLAEQWADNA